MDEIVYSINNLTLELNEENDADITKKLARLLQNNTFDLPNIIDGASLLIRCINEKATESLKILLKNGFKVNVHDDEGRTPLTQAVILNEIEMLKILLAYSENGDINALGSHYATSPLGIAFQKGYLEIIDLLLSCGADAQMIDVDNGYKPLTDSIPENLKPTVESIIKKYSIK